MNFQVLTAILLDSQGLDRGLVCMSNQVRTMPLVQRRSVFISDLFPSLALLLDAAALIYQLNIFQQ